MSVDFEGIQAFSFLAQQKMIWHLGGQRHSLDYETRKNFETARSPTLLNASTLRHKSKMAFCSFGQYFMFLT